MLISIQILYHFYLKGHPYKMSSILRGEGILLLLKKNGNWGRGVNFFLKVLTYIIDGP